MGGFFENTVDFDPSAGTHDLISNGDWDLYIQKLAPNGDFIWAKSIGGAGDDAGASINVDAVSNVYVGGYFENTVDFDPSSSTFTQTSVGDLDGFIEKLDSGGNFISVTTIGGMDEERVNFVAVDATNDIYATGFYSQTADFDPSPSATFNLTVNGREDAFVAKYSQCSPNSIDVSVTTTDPSITANATGVSYQWLDCNTNNAVIAGETGKTFTATANGSYAVEITQNGCKDTSVCVTISTVGIVNAQFSEVSIYPNPNRGEVNVDLGTLKNASIKVTNISGQVLYRKQNIAGTQHKFQLDTVQGIYFIEISAGNQKRVYKLLKM